MMRPLALFDLDNTLLAGDSDHAWGEFLIAEGMVDEKRHRASNDEFYEQYKAGKLDIVAYVAFTLESVKHLSLHTLAKLHGKFLESHVKPIILSAGRDLIAHHQSQGHCCVIITATNEFITTPIATELGVEHLIPTRLVIDDGHYSGEIIGTPNIQEGKLTNLRNWMSLQTEAFDLRQAYFYSDSINDAPLLHEVGHPITVDADSQLLALADEQGWEQISLRN